MQRKSRGSKKSFPALADSSHLTPAKKHSSHQSSLNQSPAIQHLPCTSQAKQPCWKQAVKSLGASSVESAVASLEELQEAMIDWGVVPPSEGWTAWSKNFNDMRRQAQEAPTPGGGLQEGKALLCETQTMLQQHQPKNVLKTYKYSAFLDALLQIG